MLPQQPQRNLAPAPLNPQEIKNVGKFGGQLVDAMQNQKMVPGNAPKHATASANSPRNESTKPYGSSLASSPSKIQH
jgi:hypothetical protein